MSGWANRPAEERALFNPSFCACLIWQAASGYESVVNLSLPFDITFLVLPIVLHQQVRDSLPKTTATSLVVWLNANQLSWAHISEGTRTLAPFTKEAIIFGGVHQLYWLGNGRVTSNAKMKKTIATSLIDTSDEVRACAKRAYFVGKWLAHAGDATTVMAIIGVRP